MTTHLRRRGSGTPSDRRENRRRSGRLRTVALLVALGLAIVGIAARGVVYRAVYERMSLPGLERIVRDRPDSEDAAGILGRRLLQAGQFGRAAEALRAATEPGAASGDLWLLRAEAELRAGNDRLAYGSAKVGLRSAAHPARGHWILGRVADRAGGEDEAQSEYRQATELDPKMADAWLERGRYSLRYAMPGTALEQFRRALAASPQSGEAAAGMAQALFSLGRLPEAEAAARQAVAWSPGSSRAHSWLGRILAAEGAPQAETELKQAIALSPEPGPAYQYLGTFYLQRGDVPRAAEAFRQAIESQPLQKTSYALLTQCYRRLGRAGEAEPVLRKYRRLDEMDLASAQLEYRVWASPENARLRLELAAVYLKYGRPDLARVQVERARRLEPESPAVKRMVERVSAAAPHPPSTTGVPDGDHGSK